MASLYEIDNAILECIDLETGEVIDEERLNELQMERDQKIENIALWCKNELAEAEAIKAEKKVLEERQKRHENKADSLKRYLDSICAGQKFESAKVAISYRKSKAVEVDDETLIPREWFIQQEPKLDKAGLSKALKEGVIIGGAHLVEKQNMQIK